MDTRRTALRLAKRRLPVRCWLLSALLVGCGAGPDGPPDGDVPSDAGDTGAGEPAAPEIPWLVDGAPPIATPMLTPCPEGWHEVVEEDPDGGPSVVTCDPYGDTPGGTMPDACPNGWVHFVGDAGCAPVGAPCPVGDFPVGLPRDVEVLYVLSSATAGGDGSETSPLSTITAAINLASPGTVIAIGKGEYDEALRVLPGVTLWGACAAETRLTASRPGLLAQGVITIPSADTQLTNLYIGPADLPGLVAYGARASVLIDGLVIEGAEEVGLLAANGARVHGQGLVVSGTRAGAGNHGVGLVVDGAGSLRLTRVSISDNREAGILVRDADTSATLSGVYVHGTQGRASGGRGGQGLVVMEGATATVTESLFSRNREVGVSALSEGTSLRLSDVVVRDTQTRVSDGAAGRGLNVQGGATVEVSRAVFARNHAVGAYANDEGTSLTLSDVVVRDTQAVELDGQGGRGLYVGAGAAATVSRALVLRNRDIGVLVGGEGASLTLTDVMVHGTQARENDGDSGRGLNVQFGATVIVSRAVFSRNRDLGIYTSIVGTSLTLSDVVVRDTQPRQVDGAAGRGLLAQAGARVDVARAVLSQNRDFGVIALGLDTAVQLRDVIVTQTDEQACAETTCTTFPFGVGLLGSTGASLEATRFEVVDSTLCGVMVAGNGQVDLSNGLVSGSEIGACLQVPGYSLARLTDRVRYVDNGTSLDATSLPVPEPVGLIDEAL